MRTKRRPWWISCSIYVRRRRKTMGKTPIEWSQMTWNPIVGCSIASTGCAGCYAVPFAWRFMHHPNEAIAEKYKEDRKCGVWGKSVAVRVELGGRRILQKKEIPRHST